MNEVLIENRINRLESQLRRHKFFSVFSVFSLLVLVAAILGRNRLPSLPGCHSAKFDSVTVQGESRRTVIDLEGVTVTGVAGHTRIRESSLVLVGSILGGVIPEAVASEVEISCSTDGGVLRFDTGDATMFEVTSDRLNRSAKLKLETGPVAPDALVSGVPSSLNIQVHPQTTLLDMHGASPWLQLGSADGKSRRMRIDD